MITRRSRKEGVTPTSQKSEVSGVSSPKSGSSKKSTPRSKSKNSKQNIRTRSRSRSIKVPVVMIKSLSEDEMSKKSLKSKH